MAWVSRIVDMEQVEYRLSGNAGCFVEFGDDGPASPASPAEPSLDDGLAHPPRSADGCGPVWIGSGLPAVGAVPGTALGEEGRRAARALARGLNPVKGERLVRPELRTHPSARLPGAPLVDAVEAAAAAAGRAPLELFDGKPKQWAKYETLARMVHARGERHRLHIDALHRLARAAGLPLSDIYDAQDLAEARAHAGTRVNVRVRAYDLVADLPKSTSALWALLGPEREGAFRALVHEAKRQAFAELERWIGYGLASENGELRRIATGGLLGWSVEHQSARPVDDTPGDPHLHIHIVILNLARCADGRWRAIANGGMDLHRHAKAFDALFKARVRALADERFGVRHERDHRTGAWEITGIPARLRAAYSRRAAQVDAIAGAEAARAEKLRVSARTRHAKHDTGSIDLRGHWRDRAEALGFAVDALVAAAAPGPPGPDGTARLTGPRGPRLPPVGSIAAEVFDPATGLTAHEKEFTRAQLLAAVADACPYGLDAGELEGLTDRVLAMPGYATQLPHRGSQVMANTARYTTSDIAEAGQVVADRARARLSDGSVRLDDEQAEAAISVFQVAAGFELTAEQRQAVQRLLAAGHGVDAVVGVAGSGRTSLIQACRIGWDTVGFTYAGACLSAPAAPDLHDASGVPFRTLASWLRRIGDGPGLHGLDVLVVEEAATADDRAVAALLTEAAHTGTKVVVIGDARRLRTTGSGSGWVTIHRLVGGEILRTDHRSRNGSDDAAAVTQPLNTGEHPPTARPPAGSEQVHAAETAEEARAAILSAWDAARSQGSEAHMVPADLLVLATRADDVERLNSGAQALRLAAGELGPTRCYALPGGKRLTLAVGDLVHVRREDSRSRPHSRPRPRHGVGPETADAGRAVVTEFDSRLGARISWRHRTDEGGNRDQHAWITPERISGGALSLGYAMTIAAAQHLTAHTRLVLGFGTNAHHLHPALTRASGETHLWLPAAVLAGEEMRAVPGDPQGEARLLERAVDAYARLLHQDRPDGMNSGRPRPTPAPVRLPEPAAPPEPRFPPWDDRAARPYGTLPGSLLTAHLSEAERQLAMVTAAAEARAHAREDGVGEASGSSLGRAAAARAAAELEKADRLAALAQQETRAAEAAGAAAAAARQARDSARRPSTRGRIASHLPDTLRADRDRLITGHTERMAKAYEEQRRARAVADAAHREAWRVLTKSPYAEALDLRKTGAAAPRDPAELRQRIAVLRERLPALAERLDGQGAESARRQHEEAAELRSQVTRLRLALSELAAERTLRTRIAALAPEQHAQEAAAREATQGKPAPTTTHRSPRTTRGPETPGVPRAPQV